MNLHCIGDAGPPEQWGNFADVEACCREGLSSVFIERPIDLGSPHAASWVRVIRDLHACHVRVDWRVIALESLPLNVPDRLVHLPPPQPDGSISVARWRENHEFGQLYWRRGPNFIQVKDKRLGAFQIITIDDQLSIHLFNTCMNGMDARETNSEEQALALKAMLDCGIVIPLNTCLVALPLRMKHWPIPIDSV